MSRHHVMSEAPDLRALETTLMLQAVNLGIPGTEAREVAAGLAEAEALEWAGRAGYDPAGAMERAWIRVAKTLDTLAWDVRTRERRRNPVAPAYDRWLDLMLEGLG